MEKYKKQIIAVSIAISVTVVMGAGLIARNRKPSTAFKFEPVAEERSVTTTELANGDGKDGRDCLVTVDGTVYKIEGFGLWQDGQHSTSNGQAYCGADMTDAISKSPHGRKKLEQLEKIGKLED